MPVVCSDLQGSQVSPGEVAHKHVLAEGRIAVHKLLAIFIKLLLDSFCELYFIKVDPRACINTVMTSCMFDLHGVADMHMLAKGAQLTISLVILQLDLLTAY